MLKKRLCSMFLAMTLTVGALPLSVSAAEMIVAEDDMVQNEQTIEEQITEDTQEEVLAESADETIVAEEAEETLSVQEQPSEISEDPEAYREAHRGEAEANEQQTALQNYTSRVTLLGNKSRRSIYTGKLYTVPSGKTITDGIDVSKWSKSIDWPKVKRAGTDFAIIRCGYRGYETGAMFGDEYYASNMKKAAAAGIKTGMYFYSQAISVAEAKKEAEYCLKHAKGYTVSAPIVLDVEYAEDESGECGRLYDANLSRQRQTDICLAFCKVIADAGYTPMIYANSSVLTHEMYAAQIKKNYSVWVANYTDKTTYSGGYDCWQYSEKGTVSGIDYPIDCNFGINLKLSMTKSVKLNKSSITMAYQNTASLSSKITPANSTDKVKWTSSRPAVATVSSSGKITPKSVGKTVITCTSGTKQDTCTVTVRPGKTQIRSISAQEGNAVKLTWNKRKEAGHYRIYRSSTQDGAHSYVGQSKDGSFTDTTITKGKNYYYMLRAVGKQGKDLIYSDNSSVRRAVVPEQVELKGVEKQKNGSLKVTWEKAEGAEYYRVYRASSANGPFHYIGHTEKSGYVNGKDLVKGRTYYYKVQGTTLIGGKKFKGKVSVVKGAKA